MITCTTKSCMVLVSAQLPSPSRKIAVRHQVNSSVQSSRVSFFFALRQAWRQPIFLANSGKIMPLVSHEEAEQRCVCRNASEERCILLTSSIDQASVMPASLLVCCLSRSRARTLLAPRPDNNQAAYVPIQRRKHLRAHHPCKPNHLSAHSTISLDVMEELETQQYFRIRLLMHACAVSAQRVHVLLALLATTLCSVQMPSPSSTAISPLASPRVHFSTKCDCRHCQTENNLGHHTRWPRKVCIVEDGLCASGRNRWRNEVARLMAEKV